MGSMEGTRSFLVLAVALAATACLVMILAVVIVQDRGAPAAAVDATPTPVIGTGAVPEETGGSVTMTGDGEGTFTLDRYSYDVSLQPDFERGFARVEYGRFGLRGDSFAIWFEREPLAVAQIDVDGMGFYPDPDDCSITPGALNAARGVAAATLECLELIEIRDAGTVTISGSLALPADLLGLRGELPPAGGQVVAGERSLAFGDGRLLVQDAVDEGGMQQLFLFGDDETSSIGLERDPSNGELTLTYVVVDDQWFELEESACDLSSTDLGTLSPIATVVDLSIRCEERELGELGRVAIEASLVVDLIIQPAQGH